jgi:hypothetical protein
MNSTRLVWVLTVTNAVLLVVLLALSFGIARAENEAPMLRGRGLQIVDEQGRVRASISVLPAASGEAETVLLRLITERGRPSVKIAASEASSGLSVAGPTGTKDSYAILQAGRETSTLRLRSEDGKERLLQP